MRKTQCAVTGFEDGGCQVRRNANSLKELKERILANSQQEIGTSNIKPQETEFCQQPE